MADPSPRSVLDRPVARVAALVVFALSLGALGYIHREDLFPGMTGGDEAADDPVARCVAERSRHIQAMLREGTIRADQARLFTERAERLCRVGPGRGRPLGGAVPPR